MKRADLIELLEMADACGHAKCWVRSTPGTVKKLWKTCETGEWLDWLLMECFEHKLAAGERLTLNAILQDNEYTTRLVSQEKWANEIREAFSWERVRELLKGAFDRG